MDDTVIATITASAGRRLLGILSMGTLGVLVITICFLAPPAPGLIVFLLAVGAASLWAAENMRRATTLTIELTEEGLRDSSGEVLARLDDIAGIDRGVFAFKPSNGFLLSTKTPATRVWRPGLWWRFGKRVGVGGMTPAGETKFIADYIATHVAQRDG
ncbi:MULTISPECIES: hypothetical protein [Ascidiaceihabitans]|uniref:Uncharacterized protein n=1 Tax=Ascidiaceihabitans donghaensis TaxID=1510460 RepID=A0A2R8BHT9_9RHOB|nr:hypothetical protein [Ascidiaceihabitans donghaensis]SPH22695.1 hypothetical protein ASD8599_03440 [Ascidiaceihabitans donghaensis]